MLIVVSPAKNLDYKTTLPSFVGKDTGVQLSSPSLLDKTKELVKTCKTLSPADLSSMMKISDKLAILNAERFSSFEFPFTPENARPAIYAFNGDVYAGLDAASLDQKALEFAQAHLRILSGLYGLLAPLDLMQAYRLEMGTKLNIGKANNLYEFWGQQITEKLNACLQNSQSEILVNLASNEYFSSVKPASLNARVITPQFKDEKNGKYKIISFYAKKARGLMARYIIENQITDLEALKEFDSSGYVFDTHASTDSELVFKRAEQK